MENSHTPASTVPQTTAELAKKEFNSLRSASSDVVCGPVSLAYCYFQCLYICRSAFFNRSTHIWSYPVFDNYMNISIFNYYICTQRARVLVGIKIRKINSKKIAEWRFGRRKHSGLRPQGGHVYNYKASQHVVGEPTVSTHELQREQFFYTCRHLYFIPY